MTDDETLAADHMVQMCPLCIGPGYAQRHPPTPGERAHHDAAARVVAARVADARDVALTTEEGA